MSSALPAGVSMDDVNNVDSNYLQFVVGLLDDADNFGDFVGRDRADSITEFLRRERADSISDFLRRERQDSITDFLPKQTDFLMRDRAFSWDLNMEDQLHPEKGKNFPLNESNSTADELTSSNNTNVNSSIADKKRKIDPKAPTVSAKVQKSSLKSPPLPTKTSTKMNETLQKSKNAGKGPVDVKRSKSSSSSDGKYAPKSLEQCNAEIASIVPGAVLGQVLPHSLMANGQQTLSRYDPFTVHMGHSGIISSSLLPMDGSCPRVGAYTKEERQVIIAKFRAKKMRRVWRKQIKYDCRKRLADTRPRVKGRFVSRKERESQGETKGVEGDMELENGEYEDE